MSVHETNPESCSGITLFIEKNQYASGLVQFKLIFKCQLSLEMAVTLQNEENTKTVLNFT